MTVPGGDYPDGAFDDDLSGLSGLDEATWRQGIFDAGVGPYNGAKASMDGSYARGEYVYREVTRLDNRIDELVTADGRAQIATFSTDGTWTKPPGAYKIVVDVMGGSSGGGRSNNGGSGGAHRGGLGGYSGGWDKKEFDAGEIPNSVAVTVGSGGGGGASDGAAGGAGTGSSFGSLVVAGGATAGAYGSGDFAFRMRGGNGGASGNGGSAGSAGSFHPGGLGGAPFGGAGENGASVGAAKVGMGSSGGGGAAATNFQNGGVGGDGGWPSGAGGGGGAYTSFGVAGNGGAGSSGAVYITTYYRDTAGNPPTQPTDVTASDVAQSTATITWTASTDDVRVEKYEVYLGSVMVGETSGVAYYLSQLSAATEYTVQIIAVDLGGNKSAPGEVTFTTTA